MQDYGIKNVPLNHIYCDFEDNKNYYGLTLTSPAEVNGDHIVTIDFQGMLGGLDAKNISWWVVNPDGTYGPLGAAQSFYFTSENESYQLIALLSQAAAQRLLNSELPGVAFLPYTVSAIYAPAWADAFGTIRIQIDVVDGACGNVAMTNETCGSDCLVVVREQFIKDQFPSITDMVVTSISVQRTSPPLTVGLTAPNGGAVKICSLIASPCQSITFPTTPASARKWRTLGWTKNATINKLIVSYTSVLFGNASGVEIPVSVSPNDVAYIANGAGTIHVDGANPPEVLDNVEDTDDSDSTSGNGSTGAIVGTYNGVGWSSYPGLIEPNVPNGAVTTPVLYSSLMKVESPTSAAFEWVMGGDISGGGTIYDFLDPSRYITFTFTTTIGIRRSRAADSCLWTYSAVASPLNFVISAVSNGGSGPSSLEVAVGSINIPYSLGGRFSAKHNLRLRFSYASSVQVLSWTLRGGSTHRY